MPAALNGDTSLTKNVTTWTYAANKTGLSQSTLLKIPWPDFAVLELAMVKIGMSRDKTTEAILSQKTEMREASSAPPLRIQGEQKPRATPLEPTQEAVQAGDTQRSHQLGRESTTTQTLPVARRFFLCFEINKSCK